MTERFDAIVVGAGPAGATAARELAEGGARTLLLERARLPRYKTCAGGVPLRTASLLPFSIAAVVEDTVDLIAVSVQGHRRYVRQAGSPYAYMTMRARFDGLLTQKAAEAGCTVRDAVSVRAATCENGTWRVATTSGAAEAPFLVGADGANSVVARDSGLGSDLAESVAMEAEIRAPSAAMDAWRRTVGIDLGYRPSGYAWVFPKADLLSVGLVLPKSQGRSVRTQLDRFVHSIGLGRSPADLVSGHKVLFRRRVTTLSREGALVVGDAAGLADELSEEGIYYAVRSGQLAATTILRSPDGDVRAYDEAVNREIQPELDAARAIADWVYAMALRWPGGVLLASRHIGYLWDAAFRVQRGESDYAREFARLPQGLRQLGRLLVR